MGPSANTETPMKAEEVRKATDAALERLAESLNAGQSDALTTYLAAMAKFHRYSFGNVLLIVSQKPDATHVAGFHTWRKFDRFVKKGEKGIAIFAPMMLKRRDAQTDEEREQKVLRFRVVYVFDISQTDGEPLPEHARVTGDPKHHLKRLKDFVAQKGIMLNYALMIGGGAEGVSRGGEITILSDLPPAEEFAVLVHELAHEMLHHGDDRKDFSKTVRETEAEAVAFVVTQAVGLSNSTASSDYISLYAGDAKVLADSLDRIQRTAASIIEAVVQHDAVELVDDAA